MRATPAGRLGALSAALGDAVRPVALGGYLLEVSGALIASVVRPELVGMEFGPVVILQGVLVIAAAAALLWERYRWGVALAALSTVLALTVHSMGSDLLLWLLIGIIAGIRGTWKIRIGCFIAGCLVGALAGWRVESRNAGWGADVAVFLVLLVAVGLLVGYAVGIALRLIDRAQQQAGELMLEAEEIRRTERQRLADELQVLLEHGLTELRELTSMATDRPLEELRATLTQVDELSRSLLGQTRHLLQALRGDDQPARSAAEPESRIRRRRALRLAVCGAMVLIGCVGLITAGPTIPSWVQLASCLAVAVAIWRPPPGVIAAALCLLAVVILVGQDQPVGNWAVLATAVICVVLGQRHPRWVLAAAVTVTVLVVYFVLLAARGASPNDAGHGWLHGYVALAALLAGIGWRWLRLQDAAAKSAILSITRSRDAAAEEERKKLARELHDVVAYQLSITTMMIMASSAATERGVLVGVLARLGDNVEAARCELDTLLHGLRSDEDNGAVVAPHQMARRLACELTDAGFTPQLDIDPAADELDPAQMRTVVRTMQEATSNILRYATPATPCSFHLRVDPVQTSLEINSNLSDRPRRSSLSHGMGLRGIRERVDLLGGTFESGPKHERWCLWIQLPHSTPAPGLAGSALAAAQQAVRTPHRPRPSHE